MSVLGSKATGVELPEPIGPHMFWMCWVSLALDAASRATILTVFPAGCSLTVVLSGFCTTPLSPFAMELFTLCHCIVEVIFSLIFLRVTAKRLL